MLDPESASPLIVTDLACRRGGRLVFDGLGFRLDAGRALLVTGPNGAGKSSLLKLLAGLLTPAGGSIERPGHIAYLGHDNALKSLLSVEDNLRFWAGLSAAADAEDRLARALDVTGLAALADVPARLLSAGQKRRAGLARVLASGATLWLLDEPTVGLDAAAIARLGPAFAGHLATGGMLVATSHVALPLVTPEQLAMGGR